MEEEDQNILPKSHPQSPFFTCVPVDAHPTETISKRFELWRQILKSLINYFKCIIISNKEFSKINSNITNQIDFPFFTNIRPKAKGILKHSSNASTSSLNLGSGTSAAMMKTKDQLKPMIKEKIHKHAKSLSKSQISLNLTPSSSSSTSNAGNSNGNNSNNSFNGAGGNSPSGEAEEAHDQFDITTNDMLFEIVEPKVENRKKQSFFTGFGNGSIQDVQVLLKKYHLNLSKQQLLISKELERNVLPLLEDLQRDLFEKCKEIKLLSGDFKNSMNKEIAITGQILNDYLQSVKVLQSGGNGHSIKDPFLLKLRLELQLKQQLNQENYLEEAYVNLQTTAMQLESIIYKTISESLNKYGELISQEIFVYYNDLINELHEGIVTKPHHYEWDKFIEKAAKPKLLLDLKHGQPIPEGRKLSDIKYPFNKSVISKTIRSGYFNKKSKFFKNYAKSFYILTLTHLHEFKSYNLVENFEPLHSFDLNDCILVEVNDHKFQLNVINHRSSSDSQNVVFKKTDEMSDVDFKRWVLDLKNFTSFNNFTDRLNYYGKKYAFHSSGTSSVEGVPGPALAKYSGSHGSASNDSLMTRIGKVNISSPNLSSPYPAATITAQTSQSTSNPAPVTEANPSVSVLSSSAANHIESAMKPRLQITSSMLLPKFEIQEPSPLKPTVGASGNVLHPNGGTPVRSANHSIPGSPRSLNMSSADSQSPQHCSNYLGDSSQGVNTPALATPMFEEQSYNHGSGSGSGAGGYFDMKPHDGTTGSEFQLHQSLYQNMGNTDQTADQELSHVLQRLNVGSIAEQDKL
ncbi:hypothetical protein WICPIJ_009281 [Wickerhamomyces pijperi]|uniref:PH domain-containing protein n=1 Tax=Wickerhamomyces pijperi TaxID=599730 RepID=A0A9P8TET8_WICPI|nr:hypothetical protein WICPIJ_009281 [Wickerhamomyces pijperi]